MAAGIQFKGLVFNRSINALEINKIKNTQHRGDVGSVWGKIKDWFCQTHKEEAKRLLHDVYNTKNTDSDRINSFSKLQNLVELKESRNNFKMELKEGKVQLTVLDIVISKSLDLPEIPGINEKDKTEAKTLLFDVYDANKSDSDRIMSFSKLQDLASPKPDSNFNIKLNQDNVQLTISNIIDIKIKQPEDAEGAADILKNLNRYKDQTTEQRRQIFEHDIIRMNYEISTAKSGLPFDHLSYPFVENENENENDNDNDNDKLLAREKVTNATALLDSVSKYQQRAIGMFATQKLIIEMKPCRKDYMSYGTNSDSFFKLKQYPSGDIMVDMTFESTVADDRKYVANEMGIVYANVTYGASILIGKNNSTVVSCTWTGENRLSDSNILRPDYA